MCGRLSIVYDAATGLRVAQYDERAMSREDLQAWLRPRYNVPPTSRVATLVGTEGGAELKAARWGFSTPQIPLAFNTRIEDAHRSPLWRSIVERHHGVVPVTGFYEWQNTTGKKQPHFIRRADGEPMMLAGVVGSRLVEGEPTLCMSIVTCAPNEAMRPIHDRMPVILEADGVQDWLHPESAGHERIMDLAQPAGDVLFIHRVRDDVGNVKNDAPRLMEPYGGTQRKLFDA